MFFFFFKTITAVTLTFIKQSSPGDGDMAGNPYGYKLLSYTSA